MNPATSHLARASQPPILLCFSHLRWNFVYQRPQHLMSRFARSHEVLYFEEPLFDASSEPYLEARNEPDGVCVLVPHLLPDQQGPQADAMQRALLDSYLAEAGAGARPLLLWYYTPMSLAFSDHLSAEYMVYDCMDELSAFRGAPPQMMAYEQQLLARADAVFTGGYSLYQAKCNLHENVYAFPSSVDISHFAQARANLPEPADQADIPHPRMGFHGVLDERLDTDLLESLADLRPDWHLVLVGPIVKIDAASLPQRPNIHYLGGKDYKELPAYLAGWDVALMPFALNESTRFISPTKTPEYLAGGRAVVSTPIADVVRSYGDCGMVRIADTAEAFAQAIGAELSKCVDRAALCRRADAILAGMSWDQIWSRMFEVISSGKQAAARVPVFFGAARGGISRFAGVEDDYDYLVVGAGFAGSVLAERLAAGLNKRVLVIDRRPHIGGNAYDHYNEAGVLVHKYGPHIFHTNSARVLEYLSRFTEWRPYEHRVLAQVGDKLVPMPINLTTLRILFDRDFTPEQAGEFLAAGAEAIDPVRTSEDVVLSTVGRELYEKFFRGYTRKQWGLDPSQLDKSVAARVPARCSTDDRYFTDEYQCMPLHGYTRMFEKMLDHPNITVMTGRSYDDLRHAANFGHTIYCGPVDEFFGHCYGSLPYRSLQFRHVTLDQPQFQPVAVVNYPSEDVPYTRITEYKHLTGQAHEKTSVTYEFPSAEGEPYYPVPRPENMRLFRKYQELADNLSDVTFVGRLATYRYYNMDQVVAQALGVYERIAGAEKPDTGLPALGQFAAQEALKP
jgi:UDP-galactopyranose mutase